MGLAARVPTRTVTFWIESTEAMPYALSMARAVQARFARTDVVFVQPGEGDHSLGFPVYPVPLNLGVAVLLRRLRTHTVVFGGVVPARLDALSRRASGRGVFQVLIVPGAAIPQQSHLDATIDPALLDPPAAADRLEPLLTLSRRQRLRERNRLPLTVRLLHHLRAGPLRGLLSLKFHEYDSVEALGRALGSPRTILCLGNGPSSQHPDLQGLDHDGLFRVNVSWARHGLYTDPDLVFTGVYEAVAELRPRVGFVFGTILSEEKMLGRMLFGRRRFSFCTAERLGLLGGRSDGRVAPTNGALMIATAVALRPQRLIVAGIDLFQHPAGAYPSDSTTENAYAVGHDASFELGFILEALRRHAGELTILGEPLNEAMKSNETTR